MKERPILFSEPMVQAILGGRKTQTRRAITQPISPPGLTVKLHDLDDGGYGFFTEDADIKCPFGKPGDQLWVRERFQPLLADGLDPKADWKTGKGYEISYPATDGIQQYIDMDDNISSASKPSIHMPRWASRIQLEITNIRVERLQAISEADAIAEGIMGMEPRWFVESFPEYHQKWQEEAKAGRKPPIGPSPVERYAVLWDQINKGNTNGEMWNDNPWVWVVQFGRIKP